MSLSKAITLAALLALVDGRFGQEQIPVAAVQALGDAGFGDPGVAATLAGSIPGSLLAAASPCDKLTIADQIITQLGSDQQVVEAAIGLVAAETNFNPFAVNKPFVCADATLPASSQLRGVVPLVDPAVTGSDVENANSATSKTAPFAADGLSQAEVMIAQGFSNFTAKAANGDVVALDGTNSTAPADGTENTTDSSSTVGSGTSGQKTKSPCRAGSSTAAAPAATSSASSTDTTTTNNTTTVAGDGTQSNNLDFGLCQPTMARVGGLNGRPATEFTFIPQDPLVAKGQQEALNPNIITNRICDQLINVCEASDDAHAACLDAKAEILSLGTRDQSTADTWNALLGFAGVDSSVATL